MEAQKGKVYTVWRGRTISEVRGCNFSGASVTNSFTVNVPIQLESIGFFGPFKRPSALYKMWVGLYKSKESVLSKHSEKLLDISGEIVGRKGEIFYVNGGKAKLEPGFWYQVSFQMDGPDMATLTEMELTNSTLAPEEVEIDDAENTGNKKSVKFAWLRGSKQMPTLQFSLAGDM